MQDSSTQKSLAFNKNANIDNIGWTNAQINPGISHVNGNNSWVFYCISEVCQGNQD